MEDISSSLKSGYAGHSMPVHLSLEMTSLLSVLVPTHHVVVDDHVVVGSIERKGQNRLGCGASRSDVV